jgi:glucose-induced degradation protein 4
MWICESRSFADTCVYKVRPLCPIFWTADNTNRCPGLTEDHPTLTTYFEGEIIGSQYSFFTQHEDWGANHKVDLSHWSKFNAFRPYQKQARRGPVTINDVSQKENIFMRWKEHFLVPDHRVKTITGASFEGFYYICFNQIKGEVSGIYFHSKSEK